jgi:hypothetical protein
MHGKKVRTWVDGTFDPGQHEKELDVTSLPAGTYVYQLKSGFFTDAKKLVIVK